MVAHGLGVVGLCRRMISGGCCVVSGGLGMVSLCRRVVGGGGGMICFGPLVVGQRGVALLLGVVALCLGIVGLLLGECGLVCCQLCLLVGKGGCGVGG